MGDIPRSLIGLLNIVNMIDKINGQMKQNQTQIQSLVVSRWLGVGTIAKNGGKMVERIKNYKLPVIKTVTGV